MTYALSLAPVKFVIGIKAIPKLKFPTKLGGKNGSDLFQIEIVILN